MDSVQEVLTYLDVQLKNERGELRYSLSYPDELLAEIGAKLQELPIEEAVKLYAVLFRGTKWLPTKPLSVR